MLVLLPPSEGKAEPGAGEPVDLDSLVFASELGERREELLATLDPQLRQAPAARPRSTPASHRRHALGRLLDDVEAEAGDAAGGAGLDGERRHPQSRLSHGEGGAGDVARALLEAKKPPSDPEGAAAIAESAGFTVELDDGNLAMIV